MDVEHRVRAPAPALGEGTGVDAERAAHILDEGSELGGEEEDWFGGEKGRGGGMCMSELSTRRDPDTNKSTYDRG